MALISVDFVTNTVFCNSGTILLHCAREKLAVLFVSFDCSCAVIEIMGDMNGHRKKLGHNQWWKLHNDPQWMRKILRSWKWTKIYILCPWPRHTSYSHVFRIAVWFVSSRFFVSWCRFWLKCLILFVCLSCSSVLLVIISLIGSYFISHSYDSWNSIVLFIY